MLEDRLEFPETNFDYFVLGTDLSESIVAATLSVKKMKVFQFDNDFLYSGSIKSVNLKDINDIIENKSCLQKSLLISNFEITYKNEIVDNLDELINIFGPRGFNIDLDSRVLNAESDAINQLIALGADDYINIVTIKDFLWTRLNIIEPIPKSKSDLLFSKLLSMSEKKELAKQLELIFKQNQYNENIQNSIKDFEKNIYTTNNKDNNTENNNSQSDFFDKLKISEGISVVESFLRGSLLSEYSKVSDKKDSLNVLIKNISSVINSFGVYGESPFIVPMYGAGDIAQIYNRQTSINGGIILVNKSLKLKELKYDQLTKLYHFKIADNQNEYLFTSKNIIIGEQYISLIKMFLNLELKIQLLKTSKEIYFCKFTSENKNINCPFILSFYNNDNHLVRVFGYDSKTYSSPDGHFILSFEVFHNSNDSYLVNNDILLNNIKTFYNIDFEIVSKIKYKREFDEDHNLKTINDNLFYLPSIGGCLNIEINFKNAKELLKKLNLISKEDETGLIKRNKNDDNKEKIINLDKLQNFKLE